LNRFARRAEYTFGRNRETARQRACQAGWNRTAYGVREGANQLHWRRHAHHRTKSDTVGEGPQVERGVIGNRVQHLVGVKAPEAVADDGEVQLTRQLAGASHAVEHYLAQLRDVGSPDRGARCEREQRPDDVAGELRDGLHELAVTIREVLLGLLAAEEPGQSRDLIRELRLLAEPVIEDVVVQRIDGARAIQRSVYGIFDVCVIAGRGVADAVHEQYGAFAAPILHLWRERPRPFIWRGHASPGAG
jgi:hypothetical protein